MIGAKAIGAIPREFAGGFPADSWIAEAGGTPVYVYNFGIVAARIARLRAAMPTGLDVHYAIKANPFAPLIAAIAPLVDGLDIASQGEMALALAAKAGAAISFAGPGKRDGEIVAAIEAGVTLNLESEGEATRALAAAERLGVTPRLAVRVNPEIELRGSGMRMGGRASPFGIDADQAGLLAKRVLAAGAEWCGFHIFAGSQALDPQAIIETQAETVALAGRLADEVGVTPPLVNLGGGFGIPYFPGEVPLDVEAIGTALGERMTSLPDSLKGARFAIELGRWLVGEAGVYLTRVIDRKESRGEVFLVVDGGLHHQLAASGNFGTVVKRNYPVSVASAGKDAASEMVSVVGCLCTPLDRLADRVTLPVAQPGDIIAVFMAGAYGLSASPSAFLGHELPRQILVG